MDAGQITFSAPRGRESCGRSDSEELRVLQMRLQLAEEIVESRAVAAHHDQIGHLQRR